MRRVGERAGPAAPRFALVAALVAFACGGGSGGGGAAEPSAPAGPLETPRVKESYWIPGEIMRWRVSAHGFEAAEMVLVAGQPGRYLGSGFEYFRLEVAFQAKSEGVFPVTRRDAGVFPP